MSGHLGYLAVNGVEVVNQARTLAYLRLGLSGTGQWQISDGSCCSVLTRDAFPLSTCTPGADSDEFATNPLGTRLLGALNGTVPATWAYDTTGEGDVRDVGHANGKPALYFPNGMSVDGTILAQIDVLQGDPALVASTDQFAVWRCDFPGSGAPIAIGAMMNVSAGAWRIQADLSHPSGQAANAAVSLGAGVVLPGRIWIQLSTLNDGITVSVYFAHPSTGQPPVATNTSSIAALSQQLGINQIVLTSAARPAFGAMGSNASTNAPGRYDAVTWTPNCTNTGHLYPSDGLFPMDTIYPDFYGAFRNPGVDLAPWYSSSQPQSADFLGALMEPPIDGVDPTQTRDIQPRYGGVQGAAIGPEVTGPRTLKMRLVLVAASCQGMEYGRRWFADALGQNLCDGCSLPFVDVRLACPPDDGSDDARGKWRLYEVALTDLSEQAGDSADEYCYFSVFDVTLVAGDGWLYKAPVTAAAAQPLNAAGSDSTIVSFDQWLCTVPAPVCTTIARPNIGVTAPIVTIAAGPNGLSNGIVWLNYGVYPANGLYPSDCLYPADGPSQFSNASCPTQFAVPTLTANQQITIDNSRKRVTLMGADGTLQDGTPFLQLTAGQALSWVDTEACQASDLQVCVGVAASCGADDQAAVLVQSQHRER